MDENPNDAVIETTDDTVEVVDSTEDIEAVKSRLEQVEQAKHDLEARAKKAEAELKALRSKSATPPKEVINQTLSSEDIEAKILRAQGMSQDLVDELKVVAKVRGKSLIEIQSDPIFIAIKNQKEAEKKAEEAKLPPSKGSGSAKKAREFNTPGLSAEDHKAMWKAKQG